LAFHSGRETNHSAPSSAEVKGWVELYLQSPTAPSWRGAQLGGAQGQLYFFTLHDHFPIGKWESKIKHPGNIHCVRYLPHLFVWKDETSVLKFQVSISEKKCN
jgi:hypothetical protein